MDIQLYKEATRKARLVNLVGRVVASGMLLGISVMFAIPILLLEPKYSWVSVLGLTAAFACAVGAIYVAVKGQFYDRPIPRAGEVRSDNPAVLWFILEHLKNKVLEPKERFVERVRYDIATLKKGLDAFFKDQSELERRLRTVEDEQSCDIDLSALLRIKQLVPLIQRRQRRLEAQVQKAEKIVRPIMAQINELEGHLNRLTRDERIATSLNALDQIDRKIPVNDQFLASLRTASDRTKEALAELVEDSKAVQAAWAEVQLESTLDPEDQLRLRS